MATKNERRYPARFGLSKNYWECGDSPWRLYSNLAVQNELPQGARTDMLRGVQQMRKSMAASWLHLRRKRAMQALTELVLTIFSAVQNERGHPRSFSMLRVIPSFPASRPFRPQV